MRVFLVGAGPGDPGLLTLRGAEALAMADVVVYAEKNALIGSIVCARVTPAGDVEASELELAVKRHCRDKLPKYKVPVKVFVVQEDIHGERFKKNRVGSDS